MAAYRSLESSLGISPRPIAIEEYGTTSEVGVPGPLVGYMAKFERAGVHDAELAFWNHYGTLGDTLTDTGGAPNGAYWLYKWYGDMLVTTPPARTGIDGIASRNSSADRISVIAGGCTGSCAVTVNGLNALSAFGGNTVHVKLEYTPSKGRTTASGTSTSLAGRYQITNKNSGLALDTQNAGTAQGAPVVQAASAGGTDQNWTLVAAGSGLYKIVNQETGLLLGIQNMSTADGGTALVWGDNGTADHLWQLVPSGDGYYKIADYNSGLLLGVDKMSTSPGAQVLQWGDNGTADALWKLTSR
ncbi:RICIN domain-containing protein [Streptomyces sp. NPDC002550]